MAVWKVSSFFQKGGLEAVVKGRQHLYVTRKDVAQSLSGLPHGKGNHLIQGSAGGGIPDRSTFEVRFGTTTGQRD